jgi:predicted component of type VI protein secretion system
MDRRRLTTLHQKIPQNWEHLRHYQRTARFEAIDRLSVESSPNYQSVYFVYIDTVIHLDRAELIEGYVSLLNLH